MRIQNNVTAMNSHRMYTINANKMSKNVEKLSSGYRINRAGDDAAGLAISEKMRAQIRGLTMASKNSLDAISLIQTAEGALQSTHDVLQRMREIAVQSASDTNQTEVDREALQLEFKALMDEIDDTAGKTSFNNQKLIDGSFAGAAGLGPAGTIDGGTRKEAFTVQVGANRGDELTITIARMDSQSIGKYSGDFNTNGVPATLVSALSTSNISTQQSASMAIEIVDGSINMVSMQRAALGALQNRLEFKIQNLDTSTENLQAAESRIRDTDMAKEMTSFTKNNILFQAATAMLAQANALPQGVLQLLG